ncbi:clusterin-like protein 1 [Aulostomus maculatus]
MRGLLALTFFITGVLLCTAESPPLSDDTLTKLSDAGRHYVSEEMKQALLGVTQVKEMMETKEGKHRRLMDAVRHSGVKTKGVTQLTQEMEQKLGEAEQQCQDLTKSSLEECRPCLEDTCKTFYSSTCRRGFISFSSKVEEFFRKMSSQLEKMDNQTQERAGGTSLAQNQVTEDKADLQLLQAEATFSQLLANTSLLYNHSILLVKNMPEVFGGSFPVALATGLQPTPLLARQSSFSAGFFRTTGLDHVLDSVYDFGRNMLEDFSSMVTDVLEETEKLKEFHQSDTDPGPVPAFEQPQSRYLCRRLRRQVSECWKLQDMCQTCADYLLKECPGVRQLQSEVEEMYMLLNSSRQQYYNRLLLVQAHTADTQRWFSSAYNKYGWVSQLADAALGPHDVFSVIRVDQQQKMKNYTSKVDSSVVVTTLGSGPVAVSVPADLRVDDPMFIHYVAQEALTLHKRQIRASDSGTIAA